MKIMQCIKKSVLKMRKLSLKNIVLTVASMRPPRRKLDISIQ